MKNNTKIRLHLSKQLFESLTKQVIKEGKGNMGGGAYTEAVKAPKKMKEVNAVVGTDKMKKMEEMSSKDKMKKMEEMSSKKKMELGLYKENNGKMDELSELKAKKDELEKQIKEMEEAPIEEVDANILQQGYDALLKLTQMAPHELDVLLAGAATILGVPAGMLTAKKLMDKFKSKKQG